MNTAKTTPVALIVLDGWGHREELEDNAIGTAATPFYDHLMATYPHALLDASSGSVGLPEGQMGNSEVGHMTIGAGKIIDTDLVRISKAAQNNEFATNPAFVQLFDHVKQYNSTLHVKGLVSPGGIHSHSQHLFAFLKAAKEAGITKIAIHAFTDGRDTGPKEAAAYLKELEDIIDDLGIGVIATASGRLYAMDRDNNWDRLEKVEKAVFEGVCDLEYTNCKPSEVVKELYAEGVIDELMEPVVFLNALGERYTVQANDGVFFFNFRSDRARMLSTKISEKAQNENLCFVTMTQYDKNLPALVAFPPIDIDTTLANEISLAGLTQAHIAETEKYPHATYFLNCLHEGQYPGEEHLLVPSQKVKTHDLAPEMRAKEIADKAVEQIENGTDFLFINFANADMVGHTGNVEAIKVAVETVDRELKRVAEAVLAKGGVLFITADHGNAEQNVDRTTGEKHTAHTTNLVPAIITKEGITVQNGTLADVAPTTLSLLGLTPPEAMTGENLLA
ncbi:2,3-bisphosphoglycerate-independent phosphoglycerate mutase [Candidatus Kaiserbacteria bacterium]|nr:2,3-bisphosphoglycerate-independent phosphoglycerate mutase [Candidatus Kaiserbacteria bacterium]MCB9812239.1 2,3-bisphosphoglycerate-independent phosphoglycerate mutase [Candidatus Nomurabacteria bacterium]